MNLYHGDTAADVAYSGASLFVQEVFPHASAEEKTLMLALAANHMQANIRAYCDALRETKQHLPNPSRN